MPAGCEVTLPRPLPAARTEMLPDEKVEGVRTVMMA
jgi:hypothetical protein